MVTRSRAVPLVQKYLTDIRKTAQCAICCDIWEDPVRTPCQHVFCNACILRLFQIEKTTKTQCPLCKEPFLKRSLKKCEKFGTPLTFMRETVGIFKQLAQSDLIGESFCKTPRNATLPPQTPANRSLLFTDEFLNNNVTPTATTKVSEWIKQTEREPSSLDGSSSSGPSARKFFVSKPGLLETPLSTSSTRQDDASPGKDPYNFVPSQKVSTSSKAYLGKQKGQRPVKRKVKSDLVTSVGEAVETNKKTNKRKRKEPQVPTHEVSIQPAAEVEPALSSSQPRVYEQPSRKSYTPKSRKTTPPGKTTAANDSALDEQFEALRSHFCEIEAHEMKTPSSTLNKTAALDSTSLESTVQATRVDSPLNTEIVAEPTDYVGDLEKQPQAESASEVNAENVGVQPTASTKKTRVTFALDSETQDLEQLSSDIRLKGYTQNLLLRATASDSVPLEDLHDEQDKENIQMDVVPAAAVETTPSTVPSVTAVTPLQTRHEAPPNVEITDLSLKDVVREDADAATRHSPAKKAAAGIRSPRRKPRLVSFRLAGTLRVVRKGSLRKGHTPFKLLGRLDKGRLSDNSTRDVEMQTDDIDAQFTEQMEKPHKVSAAVQTSPSNNAMPVISVGSQTDDTLTSALATGSPAKDIFPEELPSSSPISRNDNRDSLPPLPGTADVDPAEVQQLIREQLNLEIKTARLEEDEIIAQTEEIQAGHVREGGPPFIDSDDFFYGALDAAKPTSIDHPLFNHSGDDSAVTFKESPPPAEVAVEFPVPEEILPGSKSVSISSCPTQVNENLPQTITEEDDDSQDLFSPTPEKKQKTSTTLSTTPAASVQSQTPLWTPKPKFVFSGLTRSQVQQVTELANLVNADILRTFDPTATHIIVRTGEDNTAERTYKFLCGVAGKKWVLNFDWVRDCLALQGLIEEDKYEVLDMDLGDGPHRARKAKTLLFKDFEFCCVGTFTDVSIPEMQELLKMTGALVTQDPARLMRSRRYCMLVVQTEEDYKPPVDVWLKKYKAAVVSREWIVDCIASYTLQPLRPNLLSAVSDAGLLKLGIDREILDSQTSTH